MKTIVIYDSQHGNTKKIAEAIAKACKGRAIHANVATVDDVKGTSTLVIGSPTYGGRAKPELKIFLDHIPDGGLSGINIAAFDTRLLAEKQNVALRLLMRTIGYAAPKIADFLRQKGGTVILPPEGFIVNGTSGPLAEGELERATAWGESLFKKVPKE